jgi:hypothetical protein
MGLGLHKLIIHRLLKMNPGPAWIVRFVPKADARDVFRLPGAIHYASAATGGQPRFQHPRLYFASHR